MGKVSQLDKVIAQLESEISVLQLAVAKLKAQQTKAPVKRPRPVAEKSA